MALFLFRGPPIYAAGQGANANILGAVPEPAAAIAADAVPTIVWQTVADQTFTQNVSETRSLADRVSMSGGYPLRVTLSPDSPSLPSGITWDEATKSLVATTPATVTSVNGIVLRATSGVLASLPETVPAPAGAVAATATQAVPGVFASVNGSVPRPSATVTAEATQRTGIGYPTDYTIPNYWEAAPCDDGNSYTAATYQDVRHSFIDTVIPGHYSTVCNTWAAIGGDWYDAAGVKYGSTPYGSVSVTTTGAKTVTITSLVREWAGGRNNYGFFLKHQSGGGPMSLTTKWDTGNPTHQPTLTIVDSVLGTQTLAVSRDCYLVGGQSTAAIRQTVEQVSTTRRVLYWFDLSAYTVPGNITSATLNIWCTAVFGGGMTLGVYATYNPGDQSTIDSQHLGVAADYPMDANLINSPTILFTEKYNDNNYKTRVAWGEYSNIVRMLAANGADGNGFTPLLGQFDAIKCVIGWGDQASWMNWWWSPWRSTGYHPKPLAHYDELYFRYYVLFGNDFDVLNDGGKLWGFDMRYATLDSNGVYGMGNGNGGAGCDGYTGASARGGFSWDIPAVDPMTDIACVLGTYSYNMDQNGTGYAGSGSFGESPFWNRNYLGIARKAEWYCIEQHLKMNTVIPRTPISITRLEITAAAGNYCTVTATLAQPDYNMVAGDYRWITGVNEVDFNADYISVAPRISTVIDSTHFTFSKNNVYPVRSVGFVASGNIIAECDGANPDGLHEVWVNGRLAYRQTDWRWRCKQFCRDGVTPFGIDAIWGVIYANDSTVHGGSVYMSALAIGTSYIGPIVTG